MIRQTNHQSSGASIDKRPESYYEEKWYQRQSIIHRIKNAISSILLEFVSPLKIRYHQLPLFILAT